jgi:hypothetical protein
MAFGASRTVLIQRALGAGATSSPETITLRTIPFRKARSFLEA